MFTTRCNYTCPSGGTHSTCKKVQLATVHIVAVFGRSERQRVFLAPVDMPSGIGHNAQMIHYRSCKDVHRECLFVVRYQHRGVDSKCRTHGAIHDSFSSLSIELWQWPSAMFTSPCKWRIKNGREGCLVPQLTPRCARSATPRALSAVVRRQTSPSA